MHVDRGAFLLFVSALAIGGAGGYIASEKDLAPHLGGKPPPPAPTPSVTAEPPRAAVDAAVVVAAPPVVDAGPTCDDSVGEAEACPPIGLPTIEGGCGAFAANRCNDFKQTMKPRVAKAAVACLNKLNGAERCDPKRVDLCAHLALMNACEDPSVSVLTACDSLVSACASSPLTPSRSECRLAMSGLREVGRETMLDCTRKHCFDKGIIGCEVVGVPRPPQ